MDFLLQHPLERIADEKPNAVAVNDSKRQITYGELHRRSNQVAHLLGELGVVKGDRVGVYIDKSIEAVTALYGAMKAGAAYVPFDPDAPSGRLAFIARDCGIRVVLTGQEKAQLWPSLVSDAEIDWLITLNGGPEGGSSGAPVFDSTEVDSRPETSPHIPLVDHDLAYILYTSGSTGNPKGVMLTHRNALAFVRWATEEFGITSEDRLSSHAPFHFDLSIFDLFAAASAGASVTLVPPKVSLFPPQLVKFLESQRITVWYSVPSILTMLTLRGGLSAGDLLSLRAVLFAGEVFPTKYLTQLMELVPHARFANLYGPTETNVCTWYDVAVAPDPSQDIPIGKAIPNDDVFVMTEAGRPAQPGERGELYVRGATVMRGYWGDPERTSSSMVADPRQGSLGDPAYKTGDIVELLPDGLFRYVGRRDSQVKTRGYRVELGEIEAAINSHPDVMECAVIAVADDMVTNRLQAYVVAPGRDTQNLVDHCRGLLPRYMVPDNFEFLDRLPKTSTGKLDRQALNSASEEIRKVRTVGEK
jgi:amino acid adenylation domain-containing protein